MKKTDRKITEAMIEGQRKAREERKAMGLKATRTPVERAQDDPRSKMKAIAAMCWDCQGGDADPCNSWRVGNCTIKACPLWTHRPHQRFAGTPTPTSLLRQFAPETREALGLNGPEASQG